jgi:hypothetical protein
MEELKNLIRNRIIDQKNDSLLQRDGTVNEQELDWYVEICLNKMIDSAIKKVFND